MSAKRTRIMHIECKAGGLSATARIGRVTYSNSGRSLSYADKTFFPISGFKSNYMEETTLKEYWITGPKKAGGDRLYGTAPVEIDDDCREEYWVTIRGLPHRRAERSTRG